MEQPRVECLVMRLLPGGIWALKKEPVQLEEAEALAPEGWIILARDPFGEEALAAWKRRHPSWLWKKT